jgi:hypothetical protein
MKCTHSLLSVFLVVGTLSLTGCSGFSGTSLPDVPAQGQIGPIQGSDYGGHAPLANAHVFLLEADPAGSGYGAPAKSLLTSSSASTATYESRYPIVQDTTGVACTGSNVTSCNPTYGLYYSQADAYSIYAVSGGYTCDVGYPVWLMGVAGAPTSPATSNDFAYNQIVVSTGHTLTITTTTNELFYVGEQLLFTTSDAVFGPILNGKTETVVATNLGYTQFSVVTTGSIGYPSDGTYASSGTIVAEPTNNPAAVNMAMLGVCPSSGNFSAIPFVYMNEVSTVAMAYAMAGFSKTSTNNDPMHIGIPSGDSKALAGIQNAAANADQLYDIQGSNTSTVYAGEGHIARSTSHYGGGIVPQELIDALGNVLAACVDSDNTYSGYANTGGTESIACSTLFDNATQTGIAATGTYSSNAPTTPVDIATAAFNIAHHPWSEVSNLLELPTGNVPFAPFATAATDLTIGILFQNGAFSGTYGLPISTTVDASNNIWAPTYNSGVIKFAPLGTHTTFGSTSGSAYTAFDSTGNAYVTIEGDSGTFPGVGANGVYKISSGGTSTIGTPTADFKQGNMDAVDTNNLIYVTNQELGNVVSINSTGTVQTTYTNCGSSSNYFPQYVAVDKKKNLWVVGNSVPGFGTPYDFVCLIPLTGSTSHAFVDSTPSTTPTTNLNTPYGIAVDASGNGWFVNNQNNSITKVVPTTTTPYYTATNYTAATGTLVNPNSVAIDSASNLWVSNYSASTLNLLGSSGSSNTVSATCIGEFASTGVSVAGSTPAATSSLCYAGVYTVNGNETNGYFSSPFTPALDESGDVWFANQGYIGSTSGYVTELIGVGSPTLTPLSATVSTGPVVP